MEYSLERGILETQGLVFCRMYQVLDNIKQYKNLFTFLNTNTATGNNNIPMFVLKTACFKWAICSPIYLHRIDYSFPRATPKCH